MLYHWLPSQSMKASTPTSSGEAPANSRREPNYKPAAALTLKYILWYHSHLRIAMNS